MNFYIRIRLLRLLGGSTPPQYPALYTRTQTLFQLNKIYPWITKAI